MADSTLVEVFLLNQRQVSVTFHLGEWLLSCHELVGGFIYDFASVDCPGNMQLAVVVGASWGQTLSLSVLSQGLVMRVHHVAVVGEVGVVRTTSVL